MLNFDKYDFIDFGSGSGGCINFAKKKLNGTSGIGIDISPVKCTILKNLGYDYINSDVLSVDIPHKSVDFVTMSHFLEHLDNLGAVECILKKAYNTSKKFLFIEGPTFEFDEYLKSLGFKFYWSDWHGHKTKVKMNDIIDFLMGFGCKKFSVLKEKNRVVDSMDSSILPIESAPDQLRYNTKIHLNKKLVVFDKKIFKSFIIFAWIDGVIRRDFHLSRNKFSFFKEIDNE